MSLSTRAHFHHLGSVAAAAGLILAAGLALAAGPNDPQGDQPNGAKAEKRYNWSDLPSTDQVKRVSIKKIEPSEASPANAEIHFELGEGAKAVLPRIAESGVRAAQAGPAIGALPPRRMQVNFDALIRDWRRYVDDVGKCNKVTQFHNRTRRTFPLQTSSLPKSDIGPLAPGGTFSLGQSIELSPGYRGTPEDAIGDEERKKIIDNCLMIVDPRVVDDDRARNEGKWSFGYLMRRLANQEVTGLIGEVFAEHWLNHWNSDRTINGFKVERRNYVPAQVHEAWQVLSGGRYNLAKAPFRLLVIRQPSIDRLFGVLIAQKPGNNGCKTSVVIVALPVNRRLTEH